MRLAGQIGWKPAWNMRCGPVLILFCASPGLPGFRIAVLLNQS
jgi:hypothetical protein